jgi:hypothetical protein
LISLYWRCKSNIGTASMVGNEVPCLRLPVDGLAVMDEVTKPQILAFEDMYPPKEADTRNLHMQHCAHRLP